MYLQLQAWLVFSGWWCVCCWWEDGPLGFVPPLHMPVFSWYVLSLYMLSLQLIVALIACVCTKIGWLSCIGAESMLTHLCSYGLVFLSFKSLTERLTLESQWKIHFGIAATFDIFNGKLLMWLKSNKTQLSWFDNTTGYIWGGEFELSYYWPKHRLLPQNYIVTDWILLSFYFIHCLCHFG